MMHLKHGKIKMKFEERIYLRPCKQCERTILLILLFVFYSKWLNTLIILRQTLTRSCREKNDFFFSVNIWAFFYLFVFNVCFLVFK